MLDYKEIKKTVLENRKKIIQMTYDAGNQGAHIGGSLSLCEILTVLYKCIMIKIQYRMKTETGLY